MAPTTFTTIVLILFALLVFALTAYAYLGSWDVAVRRPALEPGRVEQDEVEAAVRQMRRSIEEWERSQRSH